MAELDITSTLVTPALGLIVDFESAQTAPESYEVTATDGVDPVSVSTSETKARIVGLKYDRDYTITVTAHYPDPLDDFTGSPTVVETTLNASIGEVLRQRVFDIIYDSNLTLDGRSLTLQSDGNYRPRLVRKEALAHRFPVCEVGHFQHRGSVPFDSISTVDTWACTIRLLDAVQDEDQAYARLSYLAERVRNQIDQIEYLNLSRLGIRWRGDWQIDQELTRFRDNLSGLRLIFTITQRRITGRDTLS